jgi:hypothetical protein
MRQAPLFFGPTNFTSPVTLLQVKDQSYSSPGNAALKASYETGTPVRVFRSKSVSKKSGEWCPPLYSYEGLYKVLQHRLAPSADGPLVRFRV